MGSKASSAPETFHFEDDGSIPNNPALALVVFAGRSISTARLIPRPPSKKRSSGTGGAGSGATASIPSCTTIRASTRRWASRAVMPRFGCVSREGWHVQQETDLPGQRSGAPRSLDSRVAGSQNSEAYRQGLPWGIYKSPGRNDSERASGLESESIRGPSPQPKGEGSMGCRNLTDAAPSPRAAKVAPSR